MIIKPRTFEIDEIKFANFLGRFTLIQNRPEAMLSEKEKYEAMLYKPPVCHEIAPRFVFAIRKYNSLCNNLDWLLMCYGYLPKTMQGQDPVGSERHWTGQHTSF